MTLLSNLWECPEKCSQLRERCIKVWWGDYSELTRVFLIVISNTGGKDVHIPRHILRMVLIIKLGMYS